MENGFTYTHKREGFAITTTLHSDASLDEQLEAFKGFLQACGYSIKGDIIIAEADDDY